MWSTGSARPSLPILPPGTDQRRIAFAGEDRPVVIGLTSLTCLANMTGTPAVALPLPAGPGALPLPTGPGALPVSLQLTSAVGTDEALLAAARRIAPLLGQST